MSNESVTGDANLSSLLRGPKFGRSFRGYSRKEVDAVLAQVAGGFEQLVETHKGSIAEHLALEEELRERLDRHEAAREDLEQRVRDAGAAATQAASAVREATQERERLVGELEQVKSERDELVAYVQRMEHELVHFREIEASLTHALVAAERSGSDLRQQALREADAIVHDARNEARKLIRQAGDRRERLLGDVQRIRSMLRGAIDALDVDVMPRLNLPGDDLGLGSRLHGREHEDDFGFSSES